MYQETNKTDTMRILAHGIRVNGAKSLVKCWYSIDGVNVLIYARGYSDKLPRDILPVQTDTDITTDYFAEDSAELTAEHPLYPFFRAGGCAGRFDGLSVGRRVTADRLRLDDRLHRNAFRCSA